MRMGGEKIKQEQKQKQRPAKQSESQINKQAKQTKCQDHTTADTVRESLSTPHQSLGGAADSQALRPKSASIATRKIIRYSYAAFKSTSWELKRQSSEKFLCVAGVGLVHTLGGPGQPEDFSPHLYLTYHSGASWAARIQHLGSIPKAVQYSVTRCSRRFAGWPDITTVNIVFRYQCLHRGGSLPEQRRCSSNHVAAILESRISVGVNLLLCVCASSGVHCLISHESRRLLRKGLTLLVDCISVRKIHVSPASSFAANVC